MTNGGPNPYAPPVADTDVVVPAGTMGEILGEAFRLYGRHFGLLVGMMLVVSVPVAVLSGVAYWVAGVTDTVNPSPQEAVRSMWASLFIMPLSLVAWGLEIGAITAFVTDQRLGRPTTVGSAYGRALPRLGTLFAASFLSTLGMILGMLLLIVPGLLLMLAWTLYAPAAVVERTGVIESLRRSAVLTRGRRGQLLGLLMIVGLIFTVLFLVMRYAVPTSINTIPVVGLAVHTVPMSVVTPILALVLPLVYLDSRRRREGLDDAKLAAELA